MQASIQRSKTVYLVLLAATLILGLGSRQFASVLPAVVARYSGDALWASMVVWLLTRLWPHASTDRLAVSAFVIALTVELSQLYQAPWINAVRASRVGALAFGQGFLWSDLTCYAVGVSLAALLDWRMVRGKKSARAPGT
ncbi:MAG: DUF2809 domain-containing protein [Gemmatimonadaceae bacterium]|nr:DUF2809 domain-containing protein [Gemmatimonadaceae bacterium]